MQHIQIQYQLCLTLIIQIYFFILQMNQVVLDGKSHQTKMSSTLLTEVIKEFDDEKFQNEKMQEMHYCIFLFPVF